jgi:hypothetical protein
VADSEGFPPRPEYQMPFGFGLKTQTMKQTKGLKKS